MRGIAARCGWARLLALHARMGPLSGPERLWEGTPPGPWACQCGVTVDLTWHAATPGVTAGAGGTWERRAGPPVLLSGPAACDFRLLLT